MPDSAPDPEDPDGRQAEHARLEWQRELEADSLLEASVGGQLGLVAPFALPTACLGLAAYEALQGVGLALFLVFVGRLLSPGAVAATARL
jgi:hypothetical protein